MRLARTFAWAASSLLLLAGACNSQRASESKEPIGKTSQGLLTLGQPCSADAQCDTAGTTDNAAHCVDGVCCQSACGGGARDNQACSNIYGAIGTSNGQCKTLTNGQPCGSIEPGQYCRFKATVLTNNACPQPNAGTQEQSCYPCADSTTCTDGRPVCDGTGVQAPQPLDTYFMLDHSDSMGNDCTLTANQANPPVNSKWCYATFALAKYFQSAGATGNRAALQYFTLPNSNCATGTPHNVPAVGLTTLPVAFNSTLVNNIIANGPVSGFGTDIESAARGIASFTAANVTAGRTMTGVLITDGDPNGCNGNASQLGQILANHLANTGIRTFVIGMTGASAATLQALALGGGAPAHGPQFCLNGAQTCNYYSVGNGDPAAFEAALSAIQSAAGAGCEGCTSNLNGGPRACPTQAKPVCNGGECVGCLTNADCIQFNPTKPVCEPTLHICTQCQQNSDCPTSAPICTGGQCFPCDGDTGSGQPHPCPVGGPPACILNGPGQGTCVPCTEAKHCPQDKPVCNPQSHTCGECNTNNDCSGNTPICNPNRVCVPCDGPAGGGTPGACPTELPVCITQPGPDQGKCVECTPQAPGACQGNKPVCDPGTNQCVGCTADNQCPSGVCDPNSKTCTNPCQSDTDCAVPKPVCNNGICVECTPGKPQQCVAPTPVCDPGSNTCVECTTSAQCPKDKPVCNPQTKTCTTTCSATAPCPNDVPICDPQTKTCVQCNTNADCPPGQICNPSTKTCQANPDGGVDGGVDSGTGTDSGTGADSGNPNGGDSGAGDAGPIDEFSLEGAGCNCTTVPAQSESSDARMIVALGAMLAFGVRRVRRKR